MGYSVSWLAIRGKDPSEVRDELGVSGTGEHEDVPESPLLGADLPGGWYLLFANRCDYADNAPLAKLSRRGELVTCAVEEHVMYSSAAGWRDGSPLWSIVHDCQQGAEHHDAQGELPPPFASIRDRLMAEQADRADADYVFDVPVEVAKALTGFRHDEDIAGAPAEPFERLVARRKWWQVWK